MSFSITVTEEQNRYWHRGNLLGMAREVEERVQAHKAELERLHDDFQVAVDWAIREGVDPAEILVEPAPSGDTLTDSPVATCGDPSDCR